MSDQMTAMIEDLPPPSEQAPAGWYPDPSMASVVRWWDGNGWTPRTRPNVAVVDQTRDSSAQHVATVVVVTLLVVAGLAVVAAAVLFAVAINNFGSNK